jgi:hypothetical protein
VQWTSWCFPCLHQRNMSEQQRAWSVGRYPKYVCVAECMMVTLCVSVKFNCQYCRSLPPITFVTTLSGRNGDLCSILKYLAVRAQVQQKMVLRIPANDEYPEAPRQISRSPPDGENRGGKHTGSRLGREKWLQVWIKILAHWIFCVERKLILRGVCPSPARRTVRRCLRHEAQEARWAWPLRGDTEGAGLD